MSGLPPLPGHPGAVRLLADRLASTATRLSALASVLARLRDGATWDGPAGEAFGARLREVGPVLEAVSELGLTQRTIAVFGIGCYTAFSNNLDVEVLQALHGRAPSLATGVKRAKPDTIVITIQGDGDMVNEGLQEVIHAAARGEAITCFMLDNGVFG